MNAILESQKSSSMERFDDHLESELGDHIPLPEKLGVKEYTYLSHVEVPKESRGQGLAKSKILDFLMKNPGPIYLELNDSNIMQGSIFKTFFQKLGFKILHTEPDKICMFKNR